MRKMICLLVSLVIGFSAFAIEPSFIPYIPSLGGEGTGSENSSFQNSYINSYGNSIGGTYCVPYNGEATISTDELNKQLEAGERRIAEREKIIAEVQKQIDKRNKVVDKYFAKFVKYRNKYFEIQDNETFSPEEKQTKGKKIISKIAKEIPGATKKNALYFSKAELRLAIYKAEKTAK